MHGLGSPRASLAGDQRTSLRGFVAPRYYSTPHFLTLSRTVPDDRSYLPDSAISALSPSLQHSSRRSWIPSIRFHKGAYGKGPPRACRNGSRSPAKALARGFSGRSHTPSRMKSSRSRLKERVPSPSEPMHDPHHRLSMPLSAPRRFNSAAIRRADSPLRLQLPQHRGDLLSPRDRLRLVGRR